MAEKVIHEVRIIETDDGFRIEIKGDKEHLRQMGFGKDWEQFGPGRMGRGPWGRGSWGHHGPRGFGFPFGHHRHGPWGWWTEEEEEGKAKPESPSQA